MISDDILKVLLNEEQIEKRCVELAEQIESDYKKLHAVPIVVGLLKGSVPFMAELIKRFRFDCEIDFMSVSSYDGTESIGDVRIEKDMDISCKGRHILVVEDIVDTGNTLSYLLEMLKDRQPASLRLCTLLDKPSRRTREVQVDYTAFSIPDKFVVGYGLDYDQYYRNLSYIGVVEFDD